MASVLWRCTGTALIACSCGPDVDDASTLSEGARRYAKSLCEAREACGCVARFDDQAGCEDTLAARFDAATSRLTLDDSCLDTLLTAPLDMCVSEDAWPPSLECEAFTGTKAEGEDCSSTVGLPLLRTNECDGDLVCVGGTCMASGSPAIPKAVGDRCVHETPGSCGSVELFCADDGRCHGRGIEGDACEFFDECFDPTFSASLYCAGITESSGTCAAQVSIGGACDPLDFLPCITTLDGKTTTPSHCNPASKICVEGTAPVVCESFDLPSTWP